MKRDLSGKIGAICGFVVSMTMAVFVISAFSNAVAAPVQAGHAASSFNHLKTGFPLTGAHTTAACESCHTGGVFKGTPKTCAGCHTVGSRSRATPKPARHIQTSGACESCHSSTASFQVAIFNHTGITAGCASCHNNVTAPGKSSSHVNTTAPCESCHKSTTSFLGATFSHTGITAGCASCHNNV
ncbi:MAG: hypothetical protein FD134_2793, partial [Gallionellaceae bacterium]